MPHQCTTCGHQFVDGSKEMLSGCPECGGNTFQFVPGGGGSDTATGDATEPDGSPVTDPGTDTETTSNADDTNSSVTDTNGSVTDTNGPVTDTTAEPQSHVRSGTDRIDRFEGREHGDTETADDMGTNAEPDTPSSSSGVPALREELDDQFESIKVLEPGQYELDLMELYNREEYIIALQEDGRYVIEMPESWRESE